jgi:hypothetical protein
MAELKQVYLLRLSHYETRYGAQSFGLDNEYVFGSFKETHGYMLECIDEINEPIEGFPDLSEEPQGNSYFEILTIQIGRGTNGNNDIHAHLYYDLAGQLIYDGNLAHMASSGPDWDENGLIDNRKNRELVSGKFKLGDLVHVKAFPKNPKSSIYMDTIGVISGVPLTYEQWKEAKQTDSDSLAYYGWDYNYAVSFIMEWGYLDHAHMLEEAVEPFTEDLPEELGLLRELQEYVRGRKKWSDEIVNALYEQKIFVKNVRMWAGEAGESNA